LTTATVEFVPQNLDATRWENIEPLVNALRDRPVSSPAEFQRWLTDRSELDAACSESQATLYINMTCDTQNQEAQQAYTAYIETVAPLLKPASFALDQRQTELARQFPLSPERYEVLFRDTAAEVELFRPANVPIETDLAKLSQKYEQVCGDMTVEFDGKRQTLPMMGRYQEATDRAVREGAWKAVAERRFRDADTIDGILDQMIALRHKSALNAGFDNFVPYVFKQRRRFDYGVAHCRAFHEACEKIVVPFSRAIDKKRQQALGLSELRPWDLAVDVKGRAPLRPFNGGQELMARAVATFSLLDQRLGKMLMSLGTGAEKQGCRDGASLDLDSREGKAPGGYQYMRDRSRKPFIFMNAAGLQRDVSTMLHEAGHAFHSMLSVDEPLVAYRHAPIEFCEVASMSMELLTMPYWGPVTKGGGGYYADDESLARARRQQLEKSVTLLPWIATIDAFQHWLYANPNHTREQRTAHWLELDARFGASVSWNGLEQYRKTAWHRQMHLFNMPFYYIEYGIAQLGALGLWLMSLEKGQQAAVEHYIRGLSLGGARPLPELFHAAGLPFDFGPEIVKRIVDRVAAELDKLPE
jgi:oligoendopeptidase F